MRRIQFTPLSNSMTGVLSEVPAFPGDRFPFTVPEAIGDADRTCWFGGIQFHWAQQSDGNWHCEGKAENALHYAVDLVTGTDTVDVRLRLTNDGPQAWKQSLSFNCFNCASSPALSDHECMRHYAGKQGKIQRLVELPRACGPRATIQLYSVEEAPRGQEIPFVANFKATPEVTLENWLAIRSRDGKRLAAVVSKPCLFLFQNMEYSCIHSASSFGALSPGETGAAHLRIYFAEASLEEWHHRMRAEMAG